MVEASVLGASSSNLISCWRRANKNCFSDFLSSFLKGRPQRDLEEVMIFGRGMNEANTQGVQM